MHKQFKQFKQYKQFRNANQNSSSHIEKMQNDSHFNQSGQPHKPKYKLRNKDFETIQNWFKNSQKHYSPILQKEYKSIVDKNLNYEEKAINSISNAYRIPKGINASQEVHLVQSTFINENMFHHREPRIESLSKKQKFTYRFNLQSIKLSHEFMLKNLKKISDIITQTDQVPSKANAVSCFINVFACICSQQTGAYMGNPYEQKGIACKVSSNFKQTGIITVKQDALSVMCFYLSHGMKPNNKKFVIEICLMGTSTNQLAYSEILNIGKGQYVMNANNVNSASDQIVLKGIFKSPTVQNKIQQKNRDEYEAGKEIGNNHYQKSSGPIPTLRLNRNQKTKQEKSQMQKNSTLKEKQRDVILYVGVEINPVKDLYKLLPPLVIVDCSVFLPPAGNISFKKKKYELTLCQPILLSFSEFYLYIEDFQQSQFEKQIQKSNPFQNFYQKDVCFEISKYHCLFGYHNSWKFIGDQQEQNERNQSTSKQKNIKRNQSAELQKSFKENIIYQLQTDGKGRMMIKGLPIMKKYFDDQGQLLLIFRCQVEYWIKSQENLLGNSNVNEKSYRKRKIFNIGWLPLVPSLSSEITYLNQYLVNDFQSQFPGYPIHLRSKTKLSTKIVNHGYQKYQKKKLATEQRQLRQSDVLVLPDKRKQYLREQGQSKINNQLNLSKVFDREVHKLRLKIQQTNQQRFQDEKKSNKNIQKSFKKAEKEQSITTIESQIEAYLSILQKQFVRERIRPKGTPIIIPNVQSHEFKNIDMNFLNQNLNEKTIQITFRVKALLPHTDCPSKYYIPKKISGQIYLAGSKVTFQGQFSEQSQSISYGIPVYIKNASKEHIVRFTVQNQNQMFKLIQGNICATIFDDQHQNFYATGIAKLFSLFSSNQYPKQMDKMETHQNKSTRLLLKSKQNNQFGSLIIQHKISIKKINSKQIEQINTQSIVRALPLKERLHMRVQNYNKNKKQKSNPNEAQENHAAISIYRQKNHMNFVNKVISQEYLNEGSIIYQLGIPSYMFIPFSNIDSSTNDIFSISLNSESAEVVTNVEQYNKMVKQFSDHIISSSLQEKQKQIPVLKDIHIDFKFPEEFENVCPFGFYQTRIKSNEKIYLLVKYVSNEWYFGKSMPTNIMISFRRNTILVKEIKIKLVFKEPLIEEAFYVEDLMPQGNLIDKTAKSDNLVYIKVPPRIKQTSKFITPFLKTSKYDKNKTTIDVKISNYFNDSEQCLSNSAKNLQIIVGNYEDQSNRKILRYFLIRLKLYSGDQLKLSVGQIFQYSIALNASLISSLTKNKNKSKQKQKQSLQFAYKTQKTSQNRKQPQQIILKIESSSEDIVIPYKKLVILSKYDEPKVLVNILSPTRPNQAKKVLVSLVEVQSNEVVQQRLLKIHAELNRELLIPGPAIMNFNSARRSFGTPLLNQLSQSEHDSQRQRQRRQSFNSFTILLYNYVGFRTSFQFSNKFNTGLHIFVTPSTDNIVIIPSQCDIKAQSIKRFDVQVIRTIDAKQIDNEQTGKEASVVYILVHDEKDNCIGICSAKVQEEQIIEQQMINTLVQKMI